MCGIEYRRKPIIVLSIMNIVTPPSTGRWALEFANFVVL